MVILVALMFLLRAFEDRMIYYPERALVQTPAAARLAFDDVALTTSDGVKLHAWHVKVPDARALVLHLHGNAGNISHRVDFASAFSFVHLETLLVDYRGYGRSEGTPSEEGLYRDADAALAWARGRNLPIIVYGESLGGAVGIDLAAREKVAGLVAQSTFTTLREMAGRVLPLGGLIVSQRYASIDKIGRVQAPILVVHGDADELIPYDMGVRLHAAARPPKSLLTVTGAHHNDVLDLAAPEIARRTAALIEAR